MTILTEISLENLAKNINQSSVLSATINNKVLYRKKR